MSYKIQTPAEIWRDYNPTKEPLKAECNFETLEINRARTLKDYVFLGETAEDGEILVFCRVYAPIDRKGTIILIEDYEARNNSALIDRLVDGGFAVLIPDYCDRLNCGTKFTPSTAYGKAQTTGNRLFKMINEAQDTCQFLYEKLIKRTITFALSLFPDGKLALLGAGLAAELAVMTAGNDMRVDGVVLLNGGVYREYLSMNRFENELTEILDEHAVSWMSGIASAAYAKYVTCPVLFVSATNSARFDADRMQAIVSLFKNTSVSTYHTAGGVETISEEGFYTVKEWLKRFLCDQRLPLQPDSKIRYEESTLSVYVKADFREKIKGVTVYYSFGEFDHRYRSWHRAEAKAISDTGEYLAVIPTEKFLSAVFQFAEARYAEGFCLTSNISYMEPREEEVPDDAINGRLVLNGAESYNYFRVENDENILTAPELRNQETPVGISGGTADVGYLVTFLLNETSVDIEDAILQLNFYSPKGKQIKIKAVKSEDGQYTAYAAEITVLGATEFYTAVKIEADLLKDSALMPMESWRGVKALYIESKGAVIGNILFI